MKASTIELPLLGNEEDEKKVETRIAMVDSLADLRRLNMLLTNPEFKNPQWNGDFYGLWYLMKSIISFLPGESIIQFGFCCRFGFNVSSRYLRADLKKLATYQFAKPLFDSDEILELAEDIKGKIIRLKTFSERKNCSDHCFAISACLLVTSGLGVVSTVLALGIEPAKENTNTLTALVAFAGIAFGSCMSMCVSDCCGVRLYARRRQRFHSQYTGLSNLIKNLQKWQNKDSLVTGKRMLLPDRSFTP